MQWTREAVTAQLNATLADLDTAVAHAYAVEALADVCCHAGLRYSAIRPDDSQYVAACDGQPIGLLWRGDGNHLIGGWTAAPFESPDRLGPFLTGRQAVAALAKACGVEPTHTLPPR